MKGKKKTSDLRKRNITFVAGFLACAGVIAVLAYSSAAETDNKIETEKAAQTASTMSWYKAGISEYEINSGSISLSEDIDEESVLNVKSTAAARTTKAASVRNSKMKTVKALTSKQKNNAISSKSTTAKKTTQKKTVKKTTTVKTTKKKKVKKTTTTTTRAYVPKKSVSSAYKTRDISKETYKVRSASTGKVIKANGYDMVCMVVNGEVGSSWSSEALKAQAVAAYTFIRYCDANGTIPTLGVNSDYGSKIKEAVSSVEGLVCTYQGEIINALFCASTAGSTASSANVWGGDLPYLKSVDSKYDKYDPNYGVKKTYTKSQLKKIIEENTGIKLSGKPKNWVKITSRCDGKYVKGLEIGGNTSFKKNGRAYSLTGETFRSVVLDYGIRSNAFDVSYDKSSKTFTFTTYGYGHGVGMSQWGANLYAQKENYKFDQILKHYYSNISIQTSKEN